MVKELSIKCIHTSFQNYMNVNNNNKKAMKTFKIKYNYWNLVNVLI